MRRTRAQARQPGGGFGLEKLTLQLNASIHEFRLGGLQLGFGGFGALDDVGVGKLEDHAVGGDGFPGAEDLGNMFQFKRDFQDAYCGARNLDTVRELNPSLQSFDSWLAENKGRIPLE